MQVNVSLFIEHHHFDIEKNWKNILPYIYFMRQILVTSTLLPCSCCKISKQGNYPCHSIYDVKSCTLHAFGTWWQLYEPSMVSKNLLHYTLMHIIFSCLPTLSCLAVLLEYYLLSNGTAKNFVNDVYPSISKNIASPIVATNFLQTTSRYVVMISCNQFSNMIYSLSFLSPPG